MFEAFRPVRSNLNLPMQFIEPGASGSVSSLLFSNVQVELLARMSCEYRQASALGAACLPLLKATGQ